MTDGRTKMIEDSKRPEPRFKGLAHGVKTIVREDGYRGIYRGLGPVVSCPDDDIDVADTVER
jgi:hypothetical protein